MKYFHRTGLDPAAVLDQAQQVFGAYLAPTEEGPDRRRFAGALGEVLVTVGPEGGHYVRVEVRTNQPGESEVDKLAKRFLTLVHAAHDPSHVVRGAY